MFTLGINLGFALNKWQRPNEWTEVVNEIGLNDVQMVASLCNPFWTWDVKRRIVAEINDYCAKYNIRVRSIFTDAMTRVPHLMTTKDDEHTMWFNWLKEMLELGRAMGAKTGGSHLGIHSFKHVDYPKVENQIALTDWKKLADYAHDELDYVKLIFEPMSVPRENAYTIEDTLKWQYDLGHKFGICLDVGHAPGPRGQNRNYVEWIRKVGAYSPVVHLQQTTEDPENPGCALSSDHRPFTKEGLIDPWTVMNELWETGNHDAFLCFEIGHRESWENEGNGPNKIIEDLSRSVNLWKTALRLFQNTHE
jgi:sugar phosphate isomerase/epimerase